MYKLISHRGVFDNKKIKENSLMAIKNAFEDESFVGVEFDIRETLDHKFVVFHDAYYKNKLIENTLLKDLPEYVPQLKSILNINTNKIFLIEIKNISNFEKFIKLIDNNRNKKIYIMSFYNKYVKKLLVKERFYKVGVLNYILNTSSIIKELDFVGILNSILDRNIINKLADKEIFSYGYFKTKKFHDVYYIVD